MKQGSDLIAGRRLTMKKTFIINGCTFVLDGDDFTIVNMGTDNLAVKLQSTLNDLFTLIGHIQDAADLVEGIEQTERVIDDLKDDLISCQSRYDEQRDKLFNIGICY